MKRLFSHSASSVRAEGLTGANPMRTPPNGGARRYLALCLLLPSCATSPPPPPSPPPSELPCDCDLPAQLSGVARRVDPSDPQYAKAARIQALGEAGRGKLRDAWVVRLEADVDVYRAWNGPDAIGNTNLISPWWVLDAPSGTQQRFRGLYGVCKDWNAMRWVAHCRLRRSAVVVVGHGQSVSNGTCTDPKESYPIGATWQVYIDNPALRLAELDCTDDKDRYRADPSDMSKRLPEQHEPESSRSLD